MNRPNWLLCSNCFFFSLNKFEGSHKYYGKGDCHFNPTLETVTINHFCSNWKCDNCWGGIDSWNWNEEKDKEIYVDHNKCEKVEFK